MPLITFIEHNGNAYEADIPVGDSVMEGALNNGIDGIIAECGGACVCATCHCIVDDAWVAKSGKASEDEEMMLEAVSEQKENSRLSCQMIVTEEMDGLVVHLPKSQY